VWHNLEIFFGSDTHLLEQLQTISAQVLYRSGVRIFGEGDTSDTVYYILEGSARAVRYSESGTEVWLDNFSAGNLFGEMASLVEDRRRTADMYALTDTTVATLSGKAFLSLIENNGGLGHRVCRLLAARIHNTTHRMFEHATLTATARIYAELLRMAEPKKEFAEHSAVLISDMLPISELAKKLSISRETVSRTVSKLKEEEILEAKGSDMAILKPQKLVSRLHH